MKRDIKKMSLICTVAIGALYGSGYAITMPAASQPIVQSALKANQTYNDGTYYGEGSNRIGTMGVTLTIKNDKITSVAITAADTSYRRI